METEIKAVCNTPHGLKFVTIFGYSTKGVPTLEINGGGKLSKNIKEKIIYLARVNRLKIPLKRYVLCVDMNEFPGQAEQGIRWMEFPLLLMYLYLSGNLPIRKLDDCFSYGWINTRGIINQGLPLQALEKLISSTPKDTAKTFPKLIGPEDLFIENIKQIEAEQLLQHIPYLKFNSN